MGIFDLFKRKKKPEEQKKADLPMAKPMIEHTQTASKTEPSKKQAIEKKKPTFSIRQEKTAPSDRILLRPLVTEKSTAAGAYYFKVAPTTTKNEISKAFRAKYGKWPRTVNVSNVMGKTVRRGRYTGKRTNWKKAIVTLPKNENVEVFQ